MGTFLCKLISLSVATILVGYSLLPGPDFPESPKSFVKSPEPADLESPLRRGYYTNATRDEVLEYYQEKFTKSPFYLITIPTYRLNYPPEESQTLIRDQTQSTFLEEIVHPLRESLFISGFEPKDGKREIRVEGKVYRQKVIVKYNTSNPEVRIIISLLIGFGVYLLGCELGRLFKWTYR